MTVALAQAAEKRRSRNRFKTLVTGIGLVATGGAVVAMARAALRWIIGGYEPELVGATWNSDAQSPEPAIFYIVAFVALVVLIGVVVLAKGGRHHPKARLAAGLLVAGAATVRAIGTYTDQPMARCAYDVYSSRLTCVTGWSAVMFDLLTLLGPAAVVVAALMWDVRHPHPDMVPLPTAAS